MPFCGDGENPLIKLREAEVVEIHVLIDNVTDPVSSTSGIVMSEWDVLRRAGMSLLSGACQCCANHGLSLLVRVRSDRAWHTVLFDAGPDEAAFAYNVERLKCDLSAVDAVVLSHGHWDHAGGLLKAIQLIRDTAPGRGPVPLHMHPGVFVQRGITRRLGGVLPVKPVASMAELSSAGAQPVLSAEEAFLANAAFYLSGEIPRLTGFERGLAGHVRRSDDGESWLPDPQIMDEKYLLVSVKGLGLLVISACSHAGIINVVRDALTRFPDTPLYGVFGGLHLAGSNQSIIPETVLALSELGLKLIAPGHCTGWRAVTALASRFGDKVVMPTAVGQIFSLRSPEGGIT
jgi:7,8-dihydropterin-6-yl-methyl-4-(beta-D-ribofuranosyl)aminobenzene 5'-phosphate synthase